MSGVKGRSGRRALTEETKRHRILDKAWDIVEQQLDNPNLDNKYKLDVATKLVVKDMPDVVEGMNQTQVVMMGEVKKDGVPLRFNIGNLENADPPQYP